MNADLPDPSSTLRAPTPAQDRGSRDRGGERGAAVARIFLERRNAQSAADLAALSGAVELLESDADGANAKAGATALANGYPNAQVTVRSPYLGRTDQISVTISSSVQTHFLPVLGILGLDDFANVPVIGDTETALKLAGSGGAWQGSMYAPNGTAEVSGSSDLDISGSIVGERVKISGSDFDIDGDGGAGGAGPQQLALVE